MNFRQLKMVNGAESPEIRRFRRRLTCVSKLSPSGAVVAKTEKSREGFQL